MSNFERRNTNRNAHTHNKSYMHNWEDFRSWDFFLNPKNNF